MQLLGVVQFQSGYAKEGLKLAERAVALDPKHSEAWNSLGLMRHLGGHLEAAGEAFARSVEADPANVEAWKNLGFVQQAGGDHEFALSSFERAGEAPQVKFFRANSLAAVGRHEEAVAVLDPLVKANPEWAEAWHNRANSLVALGQYSDALESFSQAIRRMGRAPGPHCNMAIALRTMGRIDEAVTILKQVLVWEPGHEQARQLLQTFQAEIKELEERAKLPDLAPEDRTDLAKHLQGQGKWRLAVDSLANESSPGGRFLEALLMPAIFESARAPGEALDHLRTRIAKLREAPPRLEDPLREVGVTTFHLPYFGISEKGIQEDIASLYEDAAPSLRFEAGHGFGRSTRKRLGVLSEALREHTISRVFTGLLERIDKDRFELVYLQVGPTDAWSERLAKVADGHVHLSPDLASAREEVAAQELDLLFYPEIGMDPLSYYLAFSRLAPVQLTTWGHPLTTGSPVMDYFISSQHFEREDGQTEYSEQLVRLPSIPAFYSKPKVPQIRERADYGLPEGKTLYACPQMAYKFHPDFDRVLSSILEQDGNGVLVLIEPQHSHYKEILLHRWSLEAPAIAERVVWLPQMALPLFLALLPLCDVLLAPIQFGGGRSTYDAFGVGAPVVTYKGDFLKGRITYAMYREIGVDGLVAETAEEYVEIALRLGRDAGWRAAMRELVAGKTGPLFENSKAVAEFNECLAGLRPR